MLKPHYAIATLYIAVATAALLAGDERPPIDHPTTPVAMRPVDLDTPAAGWFGVIRPFCNRTEVESAVSRLAPPADPDGAAFAAACFALAGRVDLARERLLTLDPDHRWRAAGVVFEMAHPVADAGDDHLAAPIMSLVVEFWPNHYLALYHAGAAYASLGRAVEARPYLEAFLRFYDVRDDWRRSAARLLEELGPR